MAIGQLLRSMRQFHPWVLGHFERGKIPAAPLTIVLAGVIGVLGGYGAVLFTFLIDLITRLTVRPFVALAADNSAWFVAICVVPAVGLVMVSWFTRRFAPEAQGHGVPEVITAVARHDGVIRPRVSLVKILASGVCIGTGGSIGREGPIVQIGSALGSMAGQMFKLSSRNIKVLVAAGAAAGISATFNAPLAGVIFASEIILGSFAAESLTPIVIASVLANVVQRQSGEHGFNPAFPQIYHQFQAAWEQLPSYFLLGLFCGLAAVGFTKLLYAVEDVGKRWFPKWWARAIVFGLLVGLSGVFSQHFYDNTPPVMSQSAKQESAEKGTPDPPLFGVGYSVIAHTLHLENLAKPSSADELKNGRIKDELISTGGNTSRNVDSVDAGRDKIVELDTDGMWAELWWLLPLVVLKPLMTTITLGGGGSGGIFAPSLYLGATLGASFGLVCNLLVPEWSANPGVYAIVGMGAVVAGTTHGVLSAILIVYEMTSDYQIILPIMVTAGLASIVARFVDPESIYTKKLSRRGESIARGHDMHRVEHIMVRNVMIRDFPTVLHTNNVTEIIRIARANPHIESLPVMDDDGQLLGIIRPEDLHRVIDSDVSPYLVNAGDIALTSLIAVSPNANLLEALRDFGTRDVDTLPVVSGRGESRRMVGILLRADVMRRYRMEMLKKH